MKPKKKAPLGNRGGKKQPASTKKAPAKPKANGTNGTRPRARKKVPRVDGKPGKPNDFTAHTAFLDALRVELDVHAACEASGLKRTTAYRHKKQDLAFAEEWDEIMDGGVDQVEGKLTGRLINGVPKKKFTAAGDPVMDPATGEQYVEVEYNDGAALRFLAARRPEIYGDKSKIEHSGVLEMTVAEELKLGANAVEGILLTIGAGVPGAKT